MSWWWSLTLALWHSCLLALKTLSWFYGCSFTCSPAVCWSLHLFQSMGNSNSFKSKGKYFPVSLGSCIRLWFDLILLPIKFIATLLETAVSLLASTFVYHYAPTVIVHFFHWLFQVCCDRKVFPHDDTFFFKCSFKNVVEWFSFFMRQ